MRVRIDTYAAGGATFGRAVSEFDESFPSYGGWSLNREMHMWFMTHKIDYDFIWKQPHWYVDFDCSDDTFMLVKLRWGI